MEFVDTHCHLQFEKFGGRENEILANASTAGVRRIICVGTTLDDSRRAADLAQTKGNVWAAAGVHPHAAEGFLVSGESVKILKEIAARPKAIAIGETGLDYYRQASSKAKQQAALRKHIEIAIELSLPIILHIRDTQPAGRQVWEDFWRIFDSYSSAKQPIKGVIHSFSSHRGQLDEILARGLYTGLNGIMTFTKDQEQLEAARAVPADRLVLETDAPFLAPAPFRNELCEPKHVATTAKFLAELRGVALGELAETTTANAVKLFGVDNR